MSKLGPGPDELFTGESPRHVVSVCAFLGIVGDLFLLSSNTIVRDSFSLYLL